MSRVISKTLQPLAANQPVREALLAYLYEQEADTLDQLSTAAVAALSQPEMVPSALRRQGRLTFIRDMIFELTKAQA